MVEIRSLARDLRAARWRLTLLHSANEHRVLWITQGQGRVLLNAQRLGIGTNNFLFIPRGLPFSLDPAAKMAGHLVCLGQEDPSPWPGTGHLLRTRDVRHQGEVMAHFDALVREQSGDRIHRQEAMAAQARLISVWLRRRLADEGAVIETCGASQRLIAAFLTDLERLYPTGSPMADYAERLDVSATHLSRVCKADLGRTAAELITERTLHAARLMLETTCHPAKTIATGLGFGSPAYFSRFIHAHTGASPKALRAQAAGQETARRF